ncbi:MAG: integration host factor subunit alpha [Deltaproteobacteria bacterium]|nr:integration host factor subunit alpha [Deltaproteobacteria bacterium]MBW2138448.1 integration host factor subunit alpha [Deltaproteobacteria bacterium]
MALTKDHIMNSIHHSLGFSKIKSAKVLESLLETIKRRLENGEDVLISGFGKFCVRDKRERRGRNPATGEDLMLSSRRVVTFKCSQVLRNKLNGRI